MIIGVMVLLFGGMVTIQWLTVIQRDQELFQIHRALKRSLIYLMEEEKLTFMEEEMLQFKEDFSLMAPTNYAYTIDLQGYVESPKMRKISVIAKSGSREYAFVEAMIESEKEE